MIIRAPFNMMLGYGHVAGNIAMRLPNALINPIGNQYLTVPYSGFEEQKMAFFSTINRARDQPCLAIWHEYDLINQHTGTGRMIGLPFFEVNQLDEIRKVHLNYCDDIIVASEWAKSVLLNNGVKKPVHVAPCGVDSKVFFPLDHQSETYHFFTIGKIEKRKCTLDLPRIFAKAFPNGENVHFHILCDSPLGAIKQMMPSMTKAVVESGIGDKITLQSNLPTDAALAAWIQSKDCGVFLTRAEGYGMPILQSLACGKPVITTDYSAHTEFSDDNNSYLVNVRNFESATDGVWFKGLGTWATIGINQENHCIDYMRYLYENNIRKAKGSVNFTWESCVNKIEAVVNAQY